jgi:D-alanyl-D-alanine carboxypeptidase
MIALPALLLVLPPFQSSIEPLSKHERARLKATDSWHRGCPVPLSGLRLLSVTYRGFDGRAHGGELVVNRSAARPLKGVFHKLYRLRFPIRHMQFEDAYGPRSERPRDGDISGSFECREAVPSPCVSASTRSWSMHAYGLAVDLNPVENPYVGCGHTRDPASRPYFDRSRHRKGMVGRHVVRAFRSIGWGWGGAWSGNTKDYMHFSSTGH